MLLFFLGRAEEFITREERGFLSPKFTIELDLECEDLGCRSLCFFFFRSSDV